MPKRVSHVVKRPGRLHGRPDVDIPVAEDLATVPGIPQREIDVSFYSRVDPIESQNVEKAADREWVWTVYTDEVREYREEHDRNNKPLVDAAAVTGDIEPTASPAGRDLTEEIRGDLRMRSAPGPGSLASERSASRGTIATTPTSARSAGPSSTMRYASPWSKTMRRLRRSQASRRSMPTSAPTRSRAPSR